VDLQLSTPGQAKSGILSTVGYHFSSINAENGDASFSRVPLDFLYYYQPSNLSFAIGGTYHVAVNYEADVPYYYADVDFENSLGAIAEIGYAVNSRVLMTLRFTKIEYEVESYFGGGELSGDHLGLGLRFGF
jgi:hypothetical protein